MRSRREQEQLQLLNLIGALILGMLLGNVLTDLALKYDLTRNGRITNQEQDWYCTPDFPPDNDITTKDTLWTLPITPQN